MSTGQQFKVECLARWRNPTGIQGYMEDGMIDFNSLASLANLE